MMDMEQWAHAAQLAEWLRKHRIPTEVAGSRMPWAPNWPLDRLSVAVADALAAALARVAALETALAEARAETQRLREAHVGLCRNGHPHYCPNCDNTFGAAPHRGRASRERDAGRAWRERDE
jgi:hypothetical protein